MGLAEYYSASFSPKNWSVTGATHGAQTATITGPTAGGYGKPNVGPENRPVSGSKIAFIYAED